MSEITSQAIGSAVDTIEWRLARQEDGPVWVALTREGRASLLPREALTEPTRRLSQDRREREEELRYFLSELPRRSGECFLLCHVGSVVGRICFTVKENEAYMWGLALHPTLHQEMVSIVVQSIVHHAAAAGIARLLAVFAASHLPVFKAEGFGVIRRYSTIVCETEDKEDHRDDPEGPKRAPKKIDESKLPYYIRQMNTEDVAALSTIKRKTSSQNGKPPSVQGVWHEEIAQLMGVQRYEPTPECAYVAEEYLEGKKTPTLLGAIQVSQWRHVAVITDVFVSRSQRRRGIGKVLVNHARISLIQSDYATMMATINESSRAQRFFRKVGFRDVQQCTIAAQIEFPPHKQPRIAGT